ncbi:MAG: tripartite tricarboxylate transporter TctB family protein [Lachnospiraceae bacterium]|nr:tripartite tricarboxylate transporter TctB family protein [Lachnospiraceae bacterium]
MTKKNDIISGIVVAVFGIAFYAGSNLIQPTTSDVLGSRFFPRVAAVMLIVLGLLQAVIAMRSEKNAQKEGASGESTKSPIMNLPLAITIVALFAYYVLIRQIGFTITSILYLLVMGWTLMNDTDRKNKKMVAIVVIVSIIFPIFINTIFYQVFRIALPAGALLG